jgi:hypothetical protein
MWEDVVRRGLAIAHQRVPMPAADKTIEQAISMNVAAFLSTEEKAHSAKTMNSQTHLGQSIHRFLDRADGAQTSRMKQRS